MISLKLKDEEVKNTEAAHALISNIFSEGN
jgi:hypothetical protein